MREVRAPAVSVSETVFYQSVSERNVRNTVM